MKKIHKILVLLIAVITTVACSFNYAVGDMAETATPEPKGTPDSLTGDTGEDNDVEWDFDVNPDDGIPVSIVLYDALETMKGWEGDPECHAFAQSEIVTETQGMVSIECYFSENGVEKAVVFIGEDHEALDMMFSVMGDIEKPDDAEFVADMVMKVVSLYPNWDQKAAKTWYAENYNVGGSPSTTIGDVILSVTLDYYDGIDDFTFETPMQPEPMVTLTEYSTYAESEDRNSEYTDDGNTFDTGVADFDTIFMRAENTNTHQYALDQIISWNYNVECETEKHTDKNDEDYGNIYTTCSVDNGEYVAAVIINDDFTSNETYFLIYGDIEDPAYSEFIADVIKQSVALYPLWDQQAAVDWFATNYKGAIGDVTVDMIGDIYVGVQLDMSEEIDYFAYVVPFFTD